MEYLEKSSLHQLFNLLILDKSKFEIEDRRCTEPILDILMNYFHYNILPYEQLTTTHESAIISPMFVAHGINNDDNTYSPNSITKFNIVIMLTQLLEQNSTEIKIMDINSKFLSNQECLKFYLTRHSSIKIIAMILQILSILVVNSTHTIQIILDGGAMKLILQLITDTIYVPTAKNSHQTITYPNKSDITQTMVVENTCVVIANISRHTTKKQLLVMLEKFKIVTILCSLLHYYENLNDWKIVNKVLLCFENLLGRGAEISKEMYIRLTREIVLIRGKNDLEAVRLRINKTS